MPALLLSVGMLLIAFGMWRLESRAWREAGSSWAAVGLCLLGTAAATVGATQTPLNWRLRVTVVCSYSAAAAFCGAIAAALAAKRRAGTVVTELGTGAPAGMTIVAAVVGPICMVALVLEAMDPSGAYSPLVLTGQGLFFLAFGIRSWLMAKTPWVLTEHGVLGPNAFLPWQHASAYDWLDSNTVAIRPRPEFRGIRYLRIPVAAKARERVEETLAGKLPSHGSGRTGLPG